MSLKDNLMRHLGMFVYQMLYLTGQEVVGQVEQALTLALNQTELQGNHHKEYLDFLTNTPAAPVTNITERSHALMTPIHPSIDSHFSSNLEVATKSSTDQGIHNQDYFVEEKKKEKEEVKQKGLRNENINFTSFGKDVGEPKSQLNDGLPSDFANGIDDSTEEWWVRHGAKPTVKIQQKNGSEQPSDRKDERRRERKYPCEICGRSFTLKGNLKRHERTHNAEKPFKCDICTKAFIPKADLKKHTCVHTREGQRSNLKTHKRAQNGESSYKEGLKRNEVKDKAERPKTNACENGESTQTHNSEHKYCCGICGEGFIRESSLSAHLRQLSASGPYICDICGQVFCQKVSLVKHKGAHC